MKCVCVCVCHVLAFLFFFPRLKDKLTKKFVTLPGNLREWVDLSVAAVMRNAPKGAEVEMESAPASESAVDPSAFL